MKRGRVASTKGQRAKDDEWLLANIGTAFSTMRRRTRSVPVSPPAGATDLRRDLLLALVERTETPLNIHAVANALTMERSAASRLVSSCVNDRLLERVASQADGRSITLRLTRRGRTALAHSRQQQREAFDYITAEWTQSERIQFARLLHKYAEAAEARSRPLTDQ